MTDFSKVTGDKTNTKNISYSSIEHLQNVTYKGNIT